MLLYGAQLLTREDMGRAPTGLADVEDAVLDHLGGVIHVLQRAGVVGVVDAEDAARADRRVDVGRPAMSFKRVSHLGNVGWPNACSVRQPPFLAVDE